MRRYYIVSVVGNVNIHSFETFIQIDSFASYFAYTLWKTRGNKFPGEMKEFWKNSLRRRITNTRVKMMIFLGEASERGVVICWNFIRRESKREREREREQLIGKPCWGNRLSIPWTVIRFDNALRSDVVIAVRDNRNKFPTPFAANARSACGFHQHSDWRLNQLFSSTSLCPLFSSFHLSVRPSVCLFVPLFALRRVRSPSSKSGNTRGESSI